MHGFLLSWTFIQSVEKVNTSKSCVATNDTHTIPYSNKMNINLFLFTKNSYVEINLSNFNGKYLLVLNNEKGTYNQILLRFLL